MKTTYSQSGLHICNDSRVDDSFRTFSFKKLVALLLYCLVLCALPVHAEEKLNDKIKIGLGGYTLTRNETEMALSDPDFGAGVFISPQETLGIQSEQTVFRLDGRYRFNPEHSLVFSWYRISTNGIKAIEEQIDWVDENGNPITIPVGASVNTEVKYDIYRLSYLWTFYHTDVVELSAGAGLHITSIAVGLQAETTSTGIDAQDVSATIPLPVVSFLLNYYVTPKFSWYINSEIFSIKFDKWDGTFTDGAVGVEYRVSKHIALGLGIGSNSLKITETTDDYKFTFANRITGLNYYVAGYF